MKGQTIINFFLLVSKLSLSLNSGDGSAQSSNGEVERTQANFTRAVTLHPDAAQVMYFA